MTYRSAEHEDFYAYNGESYNPNSGHVYLRARYYNANQGRFFQEDTYLGDIIDPLTLNRYAYVKNSPLNYADPSGHIAGSIAGDALALGAGAAVADGPSLVGDVIGVVIIIGGLSAAGVALLYEKVSQAESKKETDGCEQKESNEEEKQETSETPDVKYPGDDPTVSPGEGWEWRGPANKGSWYKPETGETLHPDLNHPAPEGPHWDYIPYKNGPQYRVHPDGTVIPK